MLSTLGSRNDWRKNSFDVAMDRAIRKMKGQRCGMRKLGCKLRARAHGIRPFPCFCSQAVGKKITPFGWGPFFSPHPPFRMAFLPYESMIQIASLVSYLRKYICIGNIVPPPGRSRRFEPVDLYNKTLIVAVVCDRWWRWKSQVSSETIKEIYNDQCAGAFRPV